MRRAYSVEMLGSAWTLWGTICRKLSLPLAAQLGTATISGAVTDSTGATIAGASIAAVNVETGFRRQTATNAIGQYNLPGLSPGQ